MEADNELENDSTFGGDRASIASSSTSMKSAIRKYEFENGRRYHAYQAGKYSFPNDEQELNRMDIEHHNQKLQMDGKLHLCPIAEHPTEIMDLGTGTGIWCIEMADEYPSAQVLGIDLSPEQPTWVPPNCKFEVDDFELEWSYGDNRFDMIHARFLVGSISNHTELYKRVYNALKPGGWFQLVEMQAHSYSDDGTLPEDSALVKWGKLIEEAFEKMGRPFIPIETYKQLLEDNGFENVEWKMMKRPSNDWPKDPKWKDIGRYCCLNYLEGLEGFTMAPFTRFLGWKPEEAQVMIAQVRKEAVKRSIHAYMKGVVCWGQKPLEPKTGA
jgi:ubiquinone/menaquinone biosynthesis C-methylase UbiE